MYSIRTTRRSSYINKRRRMLSSCSVLKYQKVIFYNISAALTMRYNKHSNGDSLLLSIALTRILAVFSGSVCRHVCCLEIIDNYETTRLTKDSFLLIAPWQARRVYTPLLNCSRVVKNLNDLRSWTQARRVLANYTAALVSPGKQRWWCHAASPRRARFIIRSRPLGRRLTKSHAPKDRTEGIPAFIDF